MNTKKRIAIARRIGWLVVGSMLALAMLGPTAGGVAAAGSATPQQVACNNASGSNNSGDVVTVTASSTGVTVHWDTTAVSGDTATVRACVRIGDAEYGSLAQDVANTGSFFFAWADFAGPDDATLAGDPCPSDSVSFAGSVDTPVVQTQKSGSATCSAEPSATPVTTPTPTPAATPTPTPAATPTATPGGGVQGETATPKVTLPPTDTLSGPTSGGSDSWRLALVALAGVLAAALLLVPDPRPKRR